MSRSYKKHYFGTWVCYRSDKPFRQAYNRSRRRVNKELVKSCERFYKDCELFVPYKSTCQLDGEVCDIDVDAYYLDLSDPHDVAIYHNNLINPEEILCNVNCKRLDKCIGCCYSENCWKDGKFLDAWVIAPDEAFCNSRVDYSISLADKWSWPSDGGLHYKGNKQSFRQEIDSEIFGVEANRNYGKRFSDTIWKKYLELKTDNYKSDYWFLDFLFLRGIIPTDFTCVEDLIKWYRKNEEKLLNTWWHWKVRK